MDIINTIRPNSFYDANTSFKLRRIFTYGIPNPQHATNGPLEQSIVSSLGPNQDATLRQIVAVLASHVNNAMLIALEQVQAEVGNPNNYAPINCSFVNLWDLPLNGVHPSVQSYEQIARERAHSSQLEGTNQTLLDLIGTATIAA